MTWDVRCIVTCTEAKPKYLWLECCCLRWRTCLMDRAWFQFSFTTTNISSAKLLNIENIHNYVKPGTLLSCLRGGEAALQPTNRGQAWYLGSSWKTQFKNWYCVKPSQSLQDVKASRSGARKPSELVCFCCLSVAVLVTVTGTFRVNGSQHIFSLSFWNST